jgi:4a-hydroxytetrahydrobiopterin dehydratase
MSAPDALSNWTEEDGALRRTVTFDGYADAVAFTVRVAMEAEKANHHPDLTLGWGKVQIVLTSHDAGGVTDRDRDLAARIDRLVNGDN